MLLTGEIGGEKMSAICIDSMEVAMRTAEMHYQNAIRWLRRGRRESAIRSKDERFCLRSRDVGEFSGMGPYPQA